MSLTFKQIISAILIVILVTVVGLWGSDTLTTLGHKFEWDLFITQEEISAQRDAKDIFEDSISMILFCNEDESISCFCTKNEVAYPTGYFITIEKKGINSLIKLNTPSIELTEKKIEIPFCFILEPWTSSIDINVGQLKLMYGTNDLLVDEYRGQFNPNLLFYKNADNKICILSKAVASEYDDITLECSKKDEVFETKEAALDAYDSGISISSLDDIFSLLSLNIGLSDDMINLMKGIIFIESYDSGIFINNNILSDPSTNIFFGGSKKGLAMLEMSGFKSFNSILNTEEGEQIVELYGYESLNWNNEFASAVLLNDNEFSVAMGYVHLNNNYVSSQISTTQDIFDAWLNYYNGKSVTYDEYFEKMNILNNYYTQFEVTISEILEEESNPHKI